jgi:uncharacterized protein
VARNTERTWRSSGTRPDLRPALPWGQRDMRILSIDGGGIRGILPASVLALCEARFTGGRPAGQFFDYIGGTSTGGIIALGLSLGMPSQDILDLYLSHGAEIFPPPRHSKYKLIRKVQQVWRFRRDLGRYRYERDALEKHLRDAYGDHLLGHAKTRLVIPSFDDYTEVNLFKTPHHPDFQLDWKDSMLKVALATSAAPTFFKLYKNGDTYYADGGVWANNPAMQIVVDALTCYDIDRSNLHLLSLGCVESEYRFSHGQITRGGIWHWREIISAAMHLQSQNAIGQAGLLIGRDHLLRIDGLARAEDAIQMDDYHRAKTELPALAKQLVEKNAVRLEAFFDQPRPAYDAIYGPRAIPDADASATNAG